jgi:hypothetical protein
MYIYAENSVCLTENLLPLEVMLNRTLIKNLYNSLKRYWENAVCNTHLL